jgi:hypothetical protein
MRILSMVSRSNNTSVSDTPFSGKVGSAGCVDFLILQKVSQDATRFIVDVVVCRVTANCHHLKMLLRVPRGLGDRVSFPFDQILIRLSSSSVSQDCLHVVNFFSIKNVWDWPGEVFSMYFCFDVGF